MIKLRVAHWFIICAAMVLQPAARADQKPIVLKVWQGAAVGDYGNIGPERVREPTNEYFRASKWITNVTVPTITVYRPPKSKNTGAAMIVCPGGGYWDLSWEIEGEEPAKWLTTIGMTGIILKYRCPRRPGQPETLPAPLPLLDAQRAISLVRQHAVEWGIDPGKIGIGGFSAGGHLALSAGTNFDKRAYEPIDEVDKVSCRPDFVVPVYPGYFVSKGTSVLASHMRIPPGTPPVFLVHASDDQVASALNSSIMYTELLKVGIPAELHIYGSGAHGFGVRKSEKATSNWTGRCVEWLRGIGILPSKVIRQPSGQRLEEPQQ